MNVPPPYWAFAWAGGQALARYLLDNPALVAGRNVLDLGSGSGLVAIAAAKAGAARVLAADIDALRPGCHRPQRGSQRRQCGDDRRRPARRTPGRLRHRAGRRPVLRAPAGRAGAGLRRCRSLTRCAWCWRAIPGAATSRPTASTSSPSTRCPSPASWRTPRSSAPRCGVSIPCVADPTRAFPVQMESPPTFRTHRCHPGTCCRDPSRCSLRRLRRAGSRCQVPG